MSNSSEGTTYRQRYKAFAYPHVAIIDPRTGRLLWKKEGWTMQNPMTPEQFVQAASDFCSRHSFEKEPMAPRMENHSSGLGGGGSGGGSSVTVPTKREMSEEEQLQAAIRASMNDGMNQQGSYDDDDDSYIIEDDDDDEDMGEGDVEDSKPAAAVESVEEESRPPTFDEEIVTMIVSDEPGAGTQDVARIMLRMPDGKRLVRKFVGQDSVKMIYAFVAVCIMFVKSVCTIQKVSLSLSQCYVSNLSSNQTKRRKEESHLNSRRDFPRKTCFPLSMNPFQAWDYLGIQ